MRLIPIVAAAVIGMSVTAAGAQSMDTSKAGNPGYAPGASTTGGKPKPVDPAEVKRMDTSDPCSARGASATGGKPKPVDPADVRRMDTTCK